MRYHILNLFSQNQYYLSPHVLLLSKHVKNRNQKLKWTLTFKIPHGTTTRARKLSRLPVSRSAIMIVESKYTALN